MPRLIVFFFNFLQTNRSLDDQRAWKGRLLHVNDGNIVKCNEKTLEQISSSTIQKLNESFFEEKEEEKEKEEETRPKFQLLQKKKEKEFDFAQKR